MNTYQAFAKTTLSAQLINTEIRAKNIKQARQWFDRNTVEHERIFLIKGTK